MYGELLCTYPRYGPRVSVLYDMWRNCGCFYAGHKFLSQNRGLLVAFIIYIVTFTLVLPLACQKLGFSTYFIKPQEPYKLIEVENEARTKHAKEILQGFQRSAAPFHVLDRRRQIEFSIVLMTSFRTPNTHYLLQVAARLLPQVRHDGGKSVITILNCDAHPEQNKDALYLSNFVTMVNCSVPVVSDAVHSRQKDDYVLGLRTAVKHNATYVLMIEDDAVPSEDFLSHLRFVLKHKMPWKFLKRRNDWAFLKLYYPEKWQGFGWPELPELIVIGFVGGCFAVWMDLKCRARIRRKLLPLVCSFIVWSAYFVLVACSVKRTHLIELRKLFLPFMYSVVKAPGCCIPGVLFQKSHALELANYLESIQCGVNYPVDVAMDDFADKRNLERYLVVPNMFSHIGLHSSLNNRLKHYAEFYLMFKP